MTKGQSVAADVCALLRARNPLIWVVTREEARAESYLFEAAAAAGYVALTWDIAQGAAPMGGRGLDNGTNDPGAMFDFVLGRAKGKQPLSGKELALTERNVWIMRDLPIWLQGMPGAVPMRQLRNLARVLPTIPRQSAQAIIVLSPSADIPAELSGHATVIEWPLPDREEIAALLDAAIDSLPDEMKESAAPNGRRDSAIDAAVGLSAEEAQACFSRSLVQLRRIDPATIASEKRRIIARERVLEWFDPLPGGLDAVGGLENLKAWLVSRGGAYTPAARAYGLPAPKGALLVGVPGCGKSLTAKAIATAWGVPLLRLDLGALKSKFVGESEGNLRRAFKVIEAIGRCVLWIDEIEKALQGATSGAADGGVSSDALGAVLSWMQDRSGEAFVIATANDVASLPPELMRKGRFDDVWFIDLPTLAERDAILAAALKTYGREKKAIAIRVVTAACEGFTGSEVAELVPDALFAAFSDGAREINADDLLESARNVTPLAKTAAEKIGKLREWAVGRARPATRSDTAAVQSRTRQLDI